jgi:hypothetical protein
MNVQIRSVPVKGSGLLSVQKKRILLVQRRSIVDDMRTVWSDAESRSAKLIENLKPVAEELDRNAKLDVEFVTTKLTDIDDKVRGLDKKRADKEDEDTRRWK